MKNILQFFSILTLIVCCFFLSNCTEPAAALKDQNTKNLSLQKIVEVREFSEIVGNGFNFDALLPTMVTISDNILYCANSASNGLFSWDITKGNQQNAWIRLNNFNGMAQGSYDLNSGNRPVLGLVAQDRGVMVAVGAAPTAGATKRGGVAYFAAQLPQAQWSMTWSVAHAQENSRETLFDLQMIRNKTGDTSLMALVEFTPAALSPARYLLWADVHAPKNGFLGIAKNRDALLSFADGVTQPTANSMGALVQLPDRRLLVAEAQGLVSISGDEIGASLKLEQRSGQVLSANHVTEWHQGLELGTRIDAVVAMRLVAQRYLIVIARDTAKKYTMTAADITKTPYVFDGNIKGDVGQIYSIVVAGDEARIVGREKIYGFKNGAFFVELDSKKLASDRAYLEKMSASDQFPNPPELNQYTFKGGTLGDVPDDGTHFYAAAPYQESWFYATDRGLFRVKKSLLTKSFRKDDEEN